MFVVDVFDDKDFKVIFEFDAKLLGLVQSLPNRVFFKKAGYWVFPIVDFFILKKICKEADVELTATPEANEKYLQMANRLKEIKDIAESKDAEHEVLGLKKEVKLYPFQRVAIKYGEEVGNGLIALDMGLGKAQPMDSKLFTDNGPINMGDVKIGDKIFGSDGLLHNVIGVYPKGKKDIYKVEFTDGSSVECCDEHLWAIKSPVQKYRNEEYRICQLNEFKDDLHDGYGNTKWFIPMVKSLKFNKKKQVIDPYVLGALIGDGSLVNGFVAFSTADSFLISEIQRLLPKSVQIKRSSKIRKIEYKIISKIKARGVFNSNPIMREVRSMGLDKLSYDKFIPDKYKFGSIKQRIAILQGLMDTDGGVDSKKDGITITYTSTSERLIDDLRFIIESLGGVARKSSRIPSYTYNGIKKKGRIAYRINISLPPSICPFRLPRKLKLYTPRTKYKPYRGVRSVKYIGKKQAQCIAVDAKDHLYITDHCILTHNTLIGMSIASNYIKKRDYKKILVICPASVKYEWAAQLNKFTDYSYSVVSGKDRDSQYRKKTSFIIVNYDLLYRDIDSIQDIEWDLVICDEIQRARNYQTDTLKALLKVKAKHRIGMTGTPIENDLMDLFTIMKYINPDIFGTAVTSFRNRYCTLDYFGRIDHSKYKNLDEINKKLCFVMLRRRKRDVLDDLPEKIVNHFYVTLGPEERKQYNEIKAGILEDIATGKIKNVTALAKVGYLRQLCDCLNLVASKEKIVSAKLKEMKQIIFELPPESKIVIFTQYERMAKIIEENLGMKSVHLHGGVKNECKWEAEIERDVIAKMGKKKVSNIDELIHDETKKAICGNCPYYQDDSKCKTRKKMVYSFTNNEEIRAFISTDAGKAGINLQKANVLINFDMSFNPAVNEQRNARIDRMGQESAKVLIINFICLDTIEEKVLKILEKKQSLFDKVIDDLSEEDAERLVMNNQNIKELV